MGKEKWATLIKYLDSTNAKPESVLNLVKQSFGVKNKPKTDDYNQMRRAWTLFVVHGIYNKSGVPEKEKKTVKISNQISYFVESKAFQMTYDLMHPITIYNEKLKKKEWNTAEESLYKKKSQDSHVRACRKLWDSAKGKLLRKELKNKKGKIPIYYKHQLNAIFEI